MAQISVRAHLDALDDRLKDEDIDYSDVDSSFERYKIRNQKKYNQRIETIERQSQSQEEIANGPKVFIDDREPRRESRQQLLSDDDTDDLMTSMNSKHQSSSQIIIHPDLKGSQNDLINATVSTNMLMQDEKAFNETTLKINQTIPQDTAQKGGTVYLKAQDNPYAGDSMGCDQLYLPRPSTIQEVSDMHLEDTDGTHNSVVHNSVHSVMYQDMENNQNCFRNLVLAQGSSYQNSGTTTPKYPPMVNQAYNSIQAAASSKKIMANRQSHEAKADHYQALSNSVQTHSNPNLNIYENVYKNHEQQQFRTLQNNSSKKSLPPSKTEPDVRSGENPNDQQTLQDVSYINTNQSQSKGQYNPETRDVCRNQLTVVCVVKKDQVYKRLEFKRSRMFDQDFDGSSSLRKSNSSQLSILRSTSFLVGQDKKKDLDHTLSIGSIKSTKSKYTSVRRSRASSVVQTPRSEHCKTFKQKSQPLNSKYEYFTTKDEISTILLRQKQPNQNQIQINNRVNMSMLNDSVDILPFIMAKHQDPALRMYQFDLCINENIHTPAMIRDSKIDIVQSFIENNHLTINDMQDLDQQKPNNVIFLFGSKQSNKSLDLLLSSDSSLLSHYLSFIGEPLRFARITMFFRDQELHLKHKNIQSETQLREMIRQAVIDKDKFIKSLQQKDPQMHQQIQNCSHLVLQINSHIFIDMADLNGFKSQNNQIIKNLNNEIGVMTNQILKQSDHYKNHQFQENSDQLSSSLNNFLQQSLGKNSKILLMAYLVDTNQTQRPCSKMCLDFVNKIRCYYFGLSHECQIQEIARYQEPGPFAAAYENVELIFQSILTLHQGVESMAQQTKKCLQFTISQLRIDEFMQEHDQLTQKFRVFKSIIYGKVRELEALTHRQIENICATIQADLDVIEKILKQAKFDLNRIQVKKNKTIKQVHNNLHEKYNDLKVSSKIRENTLLDPPKIENHMTINQIFSTFGNKPKGCLTRRDQDLSEGLNQLTRTDRLSTNLKDKVDQTSEDMKPQSIIPKQPRKIKRTKSHTFIKRKMNPSQVYPDGPDRVARGTAASMNRQRKPYKTLVADGGCRQLIIHNSMSQQLLNRRLHSRRQSFLKKQERHQSRASTGKSEHRKSAHSKSHRRQRLRKNHSSFNIKKFNSRNNHSDLIDITIMPMCTHNPNNSQQELQSYHNPDQSGKMHSKQSKANQRDSQRKQSLEREDLLQQCGSRMSHNVSRSNLSQHSGSNVSQIMRYQVKEDQGTACKRDSPSPLSQRQTGRSRTPRQASHTGTLEPQSLPTITNNYPGLFNQSNVVPAKQEQLQKKFKSHQTIDTHRSRSNTQRGEMMEKIQLQLQKLQHDNARLKIKNSRLLDEVESQAKENKKLQKQNDQQKTQITFLKNQSNHSKEQKNIHMLEQQVLLSRQQLQQKDDVIRQHLRKIEETEKQLKQLQVKYQSKLHVIQDHTFKRERIEDIKQENGQFQLDISHRDGIIQKLKSRLQAKDAQIQSLQVSLNKKHTKSRSRSNSVKRDKIAETKSKQIKQMFSKQEKLLEEKDKMIEGLEESRDRFRDQALNYKSELQWIKRKYCSDNRSKSRGEIREEPLNIQSHRRQNNTQLSKYDELKIKHSMQRKDQIASDIQNLIEDYHMVQKSDFRDNTTAHSSRLYHNI